MSIIITIPTYNEKETLESLINKIFALGLNLRILIIDDNSPDGTGELADRLAARDSRILVLHRPKKEGLGRAYLEGFRYIIKNTDAEYMIHMDADLSHDPGHIPAFLEEIKRCDVVVGSRYYKGKVSMVNWPLSRLILSYGGGIYIRLCTNLRVSDPTSGFKCFRRKVIENILDNNIISSGYVFLVEVNYICKKMGFKINEIPIVFYDRNTGYSKMRLFRNTIDALSIVWLLKFRRYNGKN